MNKLEFINQLEKSLSRLTPNERKDILRDYEEHFTFGLEGGKTEEEVSKNLGSPKQIAKEILSIYHVEKAEEKPSAGNVGRAVIAVVGLGFLNLFIVFWLLIIVVSLLFSGWAIGASFLLSPILVLIDWLLSEAGFEAFELFLSFTLFGIGMFILIGMKFATQFIVKIFIRYLRFNVSTVKRGFSNE